MPSNIEDVVCRICCLRGVTDKGMIDGVVNNCQGSLPASASWGAKDKETEAERLIWRQGLDSKIYIYVYISIRKVLVVCQKKVEKLLWRRRLYLIV